MNKFRNNVWDRNEPSYLMVPGATAGLVDFIPVNRKARRAEGRKKRTFIPAFVFPLVMVRDGYERLTLKKPHFRVSQRKAIRTYRRFIQKRSKSDSFQSHFGHIMDIKP